MAMTERPVSGPISLEDLEPKHGRRYVTNAVMTVLMGSAVVVVLIPLVAILFTVVSKGASVLGIDFFTTDIPIVARLPGPGMKAAIVGTLLVTVAASALAVPIGILAAVYLNEYSTGGPFGRLVRFMATVMTGVPSVVMGLFVYVTWTLRFKFSAFGGALALAFLMLPIVIRSTEEMLRLVPNTLREASAALGTRKSRTIIGVVLPAALPGLVSGCLLAIARAAGETAPILFVVGFTNETNWSLFEGVNTTLSAQIFSNAQLPFVGAQERAWGAALTLLIVAFTVTLVARIVTARFALKR